MIFGHLAVSALEYRYAKVEFVPVMAAAIFPDLIDKVAHYGFGLSRSGRLWGHTLLAAFLTTFLVLVLFGRRNAVSWGLGYMSHLICDMESLVPWFYPWVAYEFPEAEAFNVTLRMGLTRPSLILEFALLIWAAVALRPQLHREAQRIQGMLRGRWSKGQQEPLEP
jgi:hypothetical protein